MFACDPDTVFMPGRRTAEWREICATALSVNIVQAGQGTGGVVCSIPYQLFGYCLREVEWCWWLGCVRNWVLVARMCRRLGNGG